METKLHYNDQLTLNCAISSNKLHQHIAWTKDVAFDVEEKDLDGMKNKKLAKKFSELKKLLAKAEALSLEIDREFNDGIRYR
jgi:hypothetical protein